MSPRTFGPPRRKQAKLIKHIHAYGKPMTMGCDGRCDKAWGNNGRPQIQLSADEDDVVDLPDDVLGTAPGPGQTATISDGFDMKPSAVPLNDASRMNKWCFRECERNGWCEGHLDRLLVPNLNRPRPNVPRGKP